MFGLESFFVRFPEFKKNEFFIAGESYGGVYVPFLATKIQEYNLFNPTSPINLQGFTVGNGLVSKELDLGLDTSAEFYWWHALIS